MKKKFLTLIENKIKKEYPKYSKEEIETIMYGVETIYITITKTIIIFSLAAVLGLFKELLFLLIAFNIMRIPAFGLHASNGTICLIFSSLLFIISTILCKYLNIPVSVSIIIYILMFINIVLYAPADTVKRPLINAKKRKRYKIISIIFTLIYFLLSLFIKDNLITNSLTFGLLIECILINPITYKVFNMPYKNYISYDLSAKSD